MARENRRLPYGTFYRLCELVKKEKGFVLTGPSGAEAEATFSQKMGQPITERMVEQACKTVGLLWAKRRGSKPEDRTEERLRVILDALIKLYVRLDGVMTVPDELFALRNELQPQSVGA